MSFKLVVTDLDETLVIHHTILSDRAKNCIQQIQAKGGLFCVASGRPLCQIQPNLEKWGIQADIVISYNGAEIHFIKENKSYSYYMMEENWMKEVIDLMRPFDLNLNIVYNDINYFSKPLPKELLERYHILDFEYAIEKEEFFYKKCPKIMLRLNPDSNMEEIERYIKENPSDKYVGFKTGPTIVEFSNKLVSKGFALKEICRLTGLDISETVALGDTSNDNDLLIAAGVGVCMANGSDDTKAIADVITEKGCNEDGWAEYIEKSVLPMIS